MPTYEYKGHRFSSEGELSPEDWKQTLAYFDSIGEVGTPAPKQKEKTKWYEDIGAGLRDIPEQITQAGLMGLGGVAGLAGAEDFSDAMFEKYMERSKGFKEREEGLDRGEVGKVLRAAGQIPAYLTPITAAMMIGSGAMKTGGDLVEEGASSGHALTGAMADAGSSAAMLALGPFANLSSRTANAALQGGLNVAQEAGINHPIQNAIRESAGVQSLPAMTAGDYGAAFIPGAAMGAAFTKPRAQQDSPKPDTDPSLLETKMPSVGDLDANTITQYKAVIDSITGQIEKLRLHQAELASNGPMSEKQFKWYQSDQEKIDFKEGEIRKFSGLLSKYESNKPNQTPEELAQAIQELDITAPKETVESFSKKTGEELGGVSHLTGLISQLQEVYIKQGPEQGQALLEDMASRAPESSGFSIEVGTRGFVDELHAELTKRAEQFKGRKVGAGGTASTNKQKGSWTPFDGTDEGEFYARPDDSNAPGAVQPQPQKKGFPFRKPVAERVDPDFSDPRLRQPPPPLDEGLTAAEWAIKDDGIDPMKPPYREVPVMVKRKQPDGTFEEVQATDKNGSPETKHEYYDSREMQIWKDRRIELERTGVLDTPIGAEDDVRFGQRKFYTPESANNFVKKLEGQVESQKKAVLKLQEKLDTPIGDVNAFEAAKTKLSEMETRLGNLRSKDMGWKNDKTRTKVSSSMKDTKVDPVFPEDAERLRQQLLNEGKSERAADVEVEKQYPSHPVFRQGRLPGKESGMWTPFATSRDTNAKRALDIAKSLDFDQNIDVTKRATSKEVLERMTTEGIADSSGSTVSKIEREFAGRGQFVEANKRAQPIVWEVAKALRAAKDNEIANKRGWWSGNASKLAAKVLGPFMKLSHYKDPETPEHVKIASTDKDRVSISEYMQLAQKEHVNHILRDSPNLTEGQRKVLDAFNNLSPFQQKGVKVFTKMLEQIRATRGIPYLAGFIPHVRKGDFAVYIKTSKGDPAHLETFASKGTADAWIKMAKEKGYDVSDVVDFKTPEGQTLAESFGLVREIMTDLNSSDPQRQAWINRVMDDVAEKMSKNPDIGKHREHYTGLSGFLGSKMFKSRLENANDFFKSMEEYSTSSAAQHKKVEIIRAKNKFWDNPEGRKLRELYPNQAETADFMVDVAMNKDQKYGWTASVDTFRKKVDDAYVGMRQKVRTKLGKDPELLYYPDVPILDRVTGAGAQLFYISALTTRPGFWVGQALTSPFAIRQFLKEGSIADTIVSQGKGWGTVMTGGDAEWKAFVKDMANQSDSVHPQFMNEINALPGMGKMSSMHLDSLVQVLTGQRPAGMADAFSRYTVAAMAYHHYKNLGLSGKELSANVKQAVDNTMVMYDREHSPSVFNKMGLVGQNIAPLQKYGIAQLENLIGDLKFIAQRPKGMSTIRAMAPAISTLLTTMVMAGSVGLPLLMEYELLRAGFVGVSKFFGWDDVEDYVPGSVLELMLTNDKIRDTLIEAGVPEETAQTVENAATHGVLSAATGYDIGSSLRFNPYMPGADQQGQMSALSAFPVVKFMADMGDLALTQVRKHTAGDVTEAEDRASQLKPQFFVGQRAAIDAMKFDANNRDFVPGGQRGYAQVEQTPQEQIGQVIGAKPLATAQQNAAMQIEQRRDKKIAAQKQKAVDLLVDGLTHDNEAKIEKAYSMAIRAEMTPQQLKEQVKAVMHERNTPRLQDRFTNRKGQVKSTQQKQRYERMERYE